VADQPNLRRIRQAEKRLRRRGRKRARQLLDEAYQSYLRDLASTRNSSSNSLAASEPAAPPPQSVPQLDTPSSPALEVPASPPFREPDSPHSALTIRVRPDTPPRTPSISPPSYSPVYSPRPPSPANSTTSSVEFIEEIYTPPPRPRQYYRYDPYESLESLITQFPPRTTPLASGSFTIGPDNIDLTEVRRVIESQDPDSVIPVYLPNSPFPYDVPLPFFYNLFPPSTIRIDEIN